MRRPSADPTSLKLGSPSRSISRDQGSWGIPPLAIPRFPCSWLRDSPTSMKMGYLRAITTRLYSRVERAQRPIRCGAKPAPARGVTVLPPRPQPHRLTAAPATSPPCRRTRKRPISRPLPPGPNSRKDALGIVEKVPMPGRCCADEGDLRALRCARSRLSTSPIRRIGCVVFKRCLVTRCRCCSLPVSG